MRKGQLIGGGLVLALAALVGVGLWQTSGQRGRTSPAAVRHPEGIMGTTCTLAAVAMRRQQAEEGLNQAEAALRGVEARMSVWLEDSEVSRLNAAGAGDEVRLSPETLQVLRAARDGAAATAGAFDATCRPLIELWQRAAKRGRLPTATEIAEARAASSWGLFELTDDGATKRAAGARVDLGGIAKGYAIDRAVEALQRAGAAGGLVDVGGDLRCFGRPPDGEHWAVEVKDPSGAEPLGELHLRGGAVCTSGNYARFSVIEGRRYSHIVDPRSGRPANAVPSVTVVAGSAMRADIWATALSVLGPDGFARLPQGVEALAVLGSGKGYRAVCTPGLRDLVHGPLIEGIAKPL